MSDATEIVSMTPQQFGEKMRQIAAERDSQVDAANMRYRLRRKHLEGLYRAYNNNEDPWQHFGDA